MIRVQKSRPTQRAESTVALINVVFLMLIFFLIAGTLAPTADRQVELVTLRDGVAAAPPDMLFIRSDGTLTWRGAPVGVDAVPALMASDKGDGDDVLGAGETWIFLESGTAISGVGKCDTDGRYSNYAIVSVDYEDDAHHAKTFTAVDTSSYTLEGYGDGQKDDEGQDGAGQNSDTGQSGDTGHFEGDSKDDKFVGCKDDEWFYGHSGNDVMKGRGGADHIVGHRGNDQGFGGKGTDILIGGQGEDRLKGGDGNDHVEGGHDNDRVWGGDGCDTFKFGDGDGKDRVMDFDATGKKHDIIDLCDVSDIGGWKDLKNHVEEVDKGVWIHSDNAEIFLKGVEWADLDRGDFCF